MKLNRILINTIAGVIFASASVFAGGIQSTPAVMNTQMINRPITASAMLGPLSSTNLVWDDDAKTTSVAAGESAANFIFNFTNVSANSITVISVLSSCGCTTAQLPPLPWTIASGTSGQISVKVNLAFRSGTLFKTLNVITDKGSKLLSFRINIPSPTINTLSPMSKPVVSNVDHVHDFATAQVDRQAVFHGDCASCHVKHGEGKFGRELYYADCAICHEGEHRVTTAASLHTLSQTNSVEFWRTWIAHGKPHSLMPAFAAGDGGPLTDGQILSLAYYIAATIPSKSAGN
jgi:hypothetical protein